MHILYTKENMCCKKQHFTLMLINFILHIRTIVYGRLLCLSVFRELLSGLVPIVFVCRPLIAHTLCLKIHAEIWLTGWSSLLPKVGQKQSEDRAQAESVRYGWVGKEKCDSILGISFFFFQKFCS